MSFSHSRTVKVTIVGNSGVGKTALRKRLAGESFSQAYQKTLGYDFDLTTVNTDNLSPEAPLIDRNIAEVKLQLWEIGGSGEDSHYLAAQYCKDRPIILITLDLSASPPEMENQLKFWNDFLNKNAPKASRMVVLQKSDAQPNSVLEKDKIARIKAYARQQGNTDVIVYSAKTNDNLPELTSRLNAQIVKFINAQNPENKSKQPNPGFFSRVKQAITHPLVWGFLKWVVLPAAIATALVFSGGLAAIPVVGAYVATLGTVAALGITAAAVSLIGNMLNAVRKFCCSRSPTIVPAPVGAASSPTTVLSSSSSPPSNEDEPQHEEKEEQVIAVRQELKPVDTEAQAKRIKKIFEGLVDNEDKATEATLFKDSVSSPRPLTRSRSFDTGLTLFSLNNAAKPALVRSQSQDALAKKSQQPH